MEKIGVLLFVTTFEYDKVLNCKKKKKKDTKKREVDEEIEGRKVEGTRKVTNRRACTSRVQLNVLRRSFTKQEIITHYQRQLRYYPELKCYSRVRGKLERGQGTGVFVGWEASMTIASLRLDGSGWSQSWQFVVTRENL